MKIIAVGDIHGRDTWKRVLKDNEDFDVFVFMGDYFDNWPPMTVEKIMDTFREILAFKARHGDKVVLGIGNHDFQYMPMSGGTERYSGYNEMTQMQLDAMPEWWKTLQPAYQYNDILFTHAGLTKAWALRAGVNPVNPRGAAVQICDAFKEKPELFKFYDGDRSHCGEHTFQSPFWVRPDTLVTDPYPGLRMVVGHTHTDGVDSKGPVTMIDTGKGGEYLKVIDGVFHTGAIG